VVKINYALLGKYEKLFEEFSIKINIFYEKFKVCLDAVANPREICQKFS
jgi:hypothetical protein